MNEKERLAIRHVLEQAEWHLADAPPDYLKTHGARDEDAIKTVKELLDRTLKPAWWKREKLYVLSADWHWHCKDDHQKPEFCTPKCCQQCDCDETYETKARLVQASFVMCCSSGQHTKTTLDESSKDLSLSLGGPDGEAEVRSVWR